MTETATKPGAASSVTAPGSNGQTQSRHAKRGTVPLQLTVPLELAKIIEERAQTEGAPSRAQWILRNVAGDLNYTLPEPAARAGTRPTALFPKTLTPEQKAERFDAAKTLLAALDKGEIDLAAIKAKLGV